MSNELKFSVSGMSCKGCGDKIAKRLLEHPEITSANATLIPPEVVITAGRVLTAQEVDQWLSPLEKYHVTDEKPKNIINDNELPVTTSAETYRPLIILSLYLLLASFAATLSYGSFDIATMMRLFMGGFFVAFSFFKMLDLSGFQSAYRGYDIVAKAYSSYGYIYPFIELGLGVAYLANWFPLFTNIVTAVVMGVSLIGVMQAVFAKRKIQCACLGAVFNLPMSTVTIIEDLLMLLMALMAIYYHM